MTILNNLILEPNLFKNYMITLWVKDTVARGSQNLAPSQNLFRGLSKIDNVNFIPVLVNQNIPG